MIETPPDYINWLSEFAFKEISFGAGGLYLAPADHLTQFQVGYAFAPDGTTLCTGEAGAWQQTWLAIGHDTCVGDPLILDCSTKPFQVLTAMHGVGKWEPTIIACSLDGFRIGLEEIRKLSQNRENPVRLERNPLLPAERSSALKRIEFANPGVGMLFWQLQSQDFE
ncbi:hypothetical protein [Xanthomonas sacchari]|uniref:hypothetical protein n=1 Tax=Xanthomonas sacchari TaxID=56458 RepID=UPI0012E09991|nr:hypothetical protein [Xanthomonas sacchari]